MLLFAQPATRVVRLTIDDVTRAADGQVFVRFGEPATPVPEPFATLPLQATAQRDNLDTTTNPSARWLFPGRRAGQPLHASHLSQLVRDLGIPALAGSDCERHTFGRHSRGGVETVGPAPTICLTAPDGGAPD
jgi:hypothetical protein